MIKSDHIDSICDSIISIDITYSSLTGLIAINSLNVGGYYKITEFETTYNMPNESNTALQYQVCTVEPLIVQAKSANTLDMIAKSTLYPQDIIYYSFDNDQTKVEGCTKGFIYRRIDTLRNIDICYDWRSIKFRRWQLNVTTIWNSTTTYAKGSVVKKTGTNEVYISLIDNNLNNSLTLTDKWKRYEFDNLSYISPIKDNWGVGNVTLPINISNYLDYNIVADINVASFYNIKFTGYLDNINNYNSIILGNEFHNNTIGYYFTKNTIGNDFNSNTIGNYFDNNTIGNRFGGNVIGNVVNNSIIGNEFNNNTIGNEFYADITNIKVYNNNYSKEIIKGSNDNWYLSYFNGTNKVYEAI